MTKPQMIHKACALAMAVFCAGWAVVPSVGAQTGPRPGGLLVALEAEVRGLVDAAAPSVVTIRSACKNSGTPSHPGPSALSVGSGVIMDTLGRILTSARVVENADEHWVEMFDERIFPASLLGISGDIAVLQIDAAGLQPAVFGDAADLDVGSFVAAIGNSYGFSGGLAWGEVNGFRPDGTIQLSVGVSAGSSGGAIVDTRGRVVGLIKAKISESYYLDLPGGPGKSSYTPRRLELPTSAVSLALPIGTVLRLARNVTETGGAPAYVGVYVEDLTGWQAEHYKTKEGVLVIGVVGGSPAERYGIATGDIIRTVGSETVESVRRFRQVIVQSQPGERLTFGLLRDGRPLKVTLEAARAELPDLTSPIDVTLVTAPRPIPVIQGEQTPDPGAMTASLGATPPSAVPPREARRVSDDLEARVRLLESVVDSLLREIDALRRQP